MHTPPSINSYVDRVTAGPGGAMTDEVGVITGDLTVATILLSDGHSVRVAIQHTGGDTWYTLAAVPRPCPPGNSPPTTGTCWAASAGEAAPAPPERPLGGQGRPGDCLVAPRSDSGPCPQRS